MSSASEGPRDWNVRSVLAFAMDDFKKRGVDSPRLEAEVLLAHVLGVDRVRLVIDSERPLQGDELERFRAGILRRRRGEPLAYILGKREFYGRMFKVDARALVPRPETEILVEVALRRTAARRLFGRALDLCTGSGCVAVSFARERPTWHVTGTDRSSDALGLARENAQRLGALWGVRFAEGDLFGAIGAQERFELIVSNPPYIPSAEIAGLAEDVREFEPHLALDGGATGLDFYERIAIEALPHLTLGGVLAVEVGAGQAGDVRALFERAGLLDLELTRDYAGIERVVSGKAPAERRAS
ncbi:MAG TPA: peptide chain release factor N(5)-glutamine methyltransferase [Polyangiaceae bacterium]|nr:peptide chain release factor N(5)-glutamine methyltransferase [Polyangiaceae bacterium]